MTGAGACFARCSTANSTAVRLSSDIAKVAGTSGWAAGSSASKAPAQRPGLARLDQDEMPPGVAQGAHDRLRERHLLAQRTGEYSGASDPALEHGDLARAQRDRAEQEIDADPRDMPGLHRDRAGRQAAAGGSRARQEVATVGAIVKDNAGVRPAGFPVGREHRLHLRAAVATRAGRGSSWRPTGRPRRRRRSPCTGAGRPSRGRRRRRSPPWSTRRCTCCTLRCPSASARRGSRGRRRSAASRTRPRRPPPPRGPRRRTRRRRPASSPAAAGGARRAADRRSRRPGRTPRRRHRAARAPGRRARWPGRRASRRSCRASRGGRRPCPPQIGKTAPSRSALARAAACAEGREVSSSVTGSDAARRMAASTARSSPPITRTLPLEV